VIVRDYISNLFLMPPLDIRNDFFILYFLSFYLSLSKLMLPLRFEVCFTNLFKFQTFRINIKPIFVFHVLLDSHSEDILIYRQLNFGIDLINFSLFVFKHHFHLIDSLIVFLFDIFSSGDFLHQSRLITIALILNRLKMRFEVAEKL
jgi:hypothetical protein